MILATTKIPRSFSTSHFKWPRVHSGPPRLWLVNWHDRQGPGFPTTLKGYLPSTSTPTNSCIHVHNDYQLAYHNHFHCKYNDHLSTMQPQYGCQSPLNSDLQMPMIMTCEHLHKKCVCPLQAFGEVATFLMAVLKVLQPCEVPSLLTLAPAPLAPPQMTPSLTRKWHDPKEKRSRPTKRLICYSSKTSVLAIIEIRWRLLLIPRTTCQSLWMDLPMLSCHSAHQHCWPGRISASTCSAFMVSLIMACSWDISTSIRDSLAVVPISPSLFYTITSTMCSLAPMLLSPVCSISSSTTAFVRTRTNLCWPISTGLL